MTLGALLIGLAAAILIVAYVLAPFRRASPAVDVDAQIEAWVAEARRAEGPSSVATEEAVDVEVATASPPEATEDQSTGPVPVNVPEGKPVNFCHHCGEPVRPHHRFCPNCGTRLDEDS